MVFALCGLFSLSFAEPSQFVSDYERQRSVRVQRPLTDTIKDTGVSPAVRLIRSDDRGAEIEIISRGFDSSAEEIEGQIYHHLSLDGASLSQEEGEPQLPLRVMMLGIPLEANVAVEVVEVETERSFNYHVYPAPRRVLSRTKSGEPFTTTEFYRNDPLYSQNTFFPPRIAKMTQIAFIRDQRVAQLEVCPLQYNPASGELLFHKRLILRVTFGNGSQGDLAGFEEPGFIPTDVGPFQSILKNTLLNYESSRYWQQRRAALPKFMPVETETPYGDSTAYRITVKEDGIYSLSYEYLQSQGVAVSAIDPKTVKMYNRGEQIPSYVYGARDNQFDSGDYIQFRGEVYHGENHYYSPYTETNVYWLVSGGDIGMRMVEQDGGLVVEDPDSLIIPLSYKATLHVERDLSYQRLSQVSDESIDRWLMDEINADTTRDYSFYLTAVDDSDSAECEIEIRLRGITFPYQDPDHHTKIWLNGNKLDEAWWDGQDEYIYHRTGLPNSWLWEGNNLLRIANIGDTEAGDVDKIYTNWFQIDYWRGYVAQDDYLEFGPPEGSELGLYQFTVSGFTSSDIELFDVAGKKIVNFQVSQDSVGYTIKFQDQVVRPTQYVALTRSKLKLPTGVYPNQASDLRSPANAADYIIVVHSDFYESVLPLAAHRQSEGLRVKVVLVQDIYDEFNDGVLSPEAIRDFLKYAYANWSTPAPVYLLLVGDTSWGYDKPITHQSYWREPCFVPTLMAWTSAWGVSAADNRLVCLVGDDRFPDMAIGRFPVGTKAEADLMVDKILQYETSPQIGPWRKRVYLLAGEGTVFERAQVELDSGYIPPCYEVPRINTRSSSIHYGTTQDLLSQWDEGVILASFTGHGGGSVWFDANFFLLEHVPLLNNGQRLPVVFSLTCFVGYFDNPWYSSLGEEIVRVEGKGAVAHFGSSGVAWANEDNLLGQNLFRAIFQDGERAIGIVTTQGKLGLRHISSELIDVFNLLGDPAMKIGLPQHELSLELAESSLPMGETISVQGTIPGNPDGTVEVVFCDNDTSGWLVDTTGISLVDKGFAPRNPVAQQEISVTNGQFSRQLTPPDTIPEYPFYQPSAGKKSVSAYFWNQETDAIGWAPLYLEVPCLSNIRYEPEKPMAWEEIYVFADVDLGTGVDPDGPDSVMCLWSLRSDMQFVNYLIMSTEDGHTYKTDGSISAQGGAYVYYRIQVKYGGEGGAPSSQSYLSGKRSFQVNRIPNLWVARKDISLSVNNDELWVNCWVHNKGVIDLDSVKVRFYDDSPDSNKPIGSDQLIPVVSAGDSAMAEVSWEGPGEPHDVYVWVDPEMELEEAPTFDNKAHRYFSNIFLVTPQHGTTVRGSNATVFHTHGNVACQIPAGAPSSSSLLFVNHQAPDSTYYAQKYDPALLNQPNLSLSALKDSSCNLYSMVFEDSTLIPSSPATIAFWYHFQDSLTRLAVQENNLKICCLSEEVGKWILLSDQEVVVDSVMVQTYVDHLGLFGLFILDDQKPPTVRINVEGQSFANGDYISANPIISATIEDENGIDIHNYPVELSLNGNPVVSSDFSSAYSPQTSNLCLLTYAPQLSVGPYTMEIKAYDCFGNSAVDSIFFNVTAGFQVPFVATHPNPFQTEMVFAYVVAADSPAEQVTIKIYTIRGRLIRTFQNHNVGPGYVEVVWDGRDSEGERVANGVYYYKLKVVRSDGKEISPILGKIAKLE
jgi:hypothetical protein